MFIELGHFAFISMFAMSVFFMILFAISYIYKEKAFFCVKYGIPFWQCLLSIFCLFSLVNAYINSDFSVMIVVGSSYSEKPLFFKIAALWSTQEGTLLLWIVFLQIFTFVYHLSVHKRFNLATAAFEFRAFHNLVLFWQNFILANFCIFMLCLANPFWRSETNILQGLGLNPLLQDGALAIHPPLLYMGYAALTLCFSIVMAGLCYAKHEIIWVAFAKKWALIAWLLLTLAISMGAYWAYYELGWGGYWSWDPVENLSLLPWLSLLCFLHSLYLFEKYNILLRSSIFLCIFAFFLVLLALFFVRSGLLNSVHSFALDPRKAFGLAGANALILLPSFVVFFYQGRFLQKKNFWQISKQNLWVISALILVFLMLLGILFGTIYPLLYQALYGKIAVIDACFFVYCASLFTISCSLILIFITLSYQQHLKLSILCFTLLLAGFFSVSQNLFYSLFFAVGGLVACVFFTKFLFMARLKEAYKTFSLPAFFSHIGLSLILIAIAVNGAFTYSKSYQLLVGQSLSIEGYNLRFEKIEWHDHSNYKEQNFIFALWPKDQPKKSAVSAKIYDKNLEFLVPSTRFFSLQNLKTNEIALSSEGLSQIYMVPLGEQKGAYFFIIYWQAGIWLFIIAIFFMILGAALALIRQFKVTAL